MENNSAYLIPYNHVIHLNHVNILCHLAFQVLVSVLQRSVSMGKIQ